jgi:hypothetical protein
VPIATLAQIRVYVTGAGAISSVLYSPAVEGNLITAGVKHDYQKPVIAFNGGVIVQIKGGKYFELRSGIEFFKKGWKINYFDEGDSTHLPSDKLLRKYNLNYLQIPVTLIYATPIGIGKLYVGIGPYLAYALNGEVSTPDKTFDLQFEKYNEYVFRYTPDDHTPIRYITHYTANRFDYGIESVMGYEFEFGLFIEAKYNIGFRNVSTSYERYSSEWNGTVRDPSLRSKYSIFQLGIGLLINNR